MTDTRAPAEWAKFAEMLERRAANSAPSSEFHCAMVATAACARQIVASPPSPNIAELVEALEGLRTTVAILASGVSIVPSEGGYAMQMYQDRLAQIDRAIASYRGGK